MKRILSFGLVLAMTAALLMIPAGAVEESTAEKTARTLAETLVSAYGATSAQYAVMQGGEIKISGTAGVYSKSENRVLTAENLYGIGSTSKMFVSAAI